METVNKISRMKELVTLLNEADVAYYRDDEPIMTDREYDALTEELKSLETVTGLVFANSPTKKVSGANKTQLQKVQHSKPMLSAQKTRSEDELCAFAAGQDVVLSNKLDGLTLVLRYRNGAFVQAITRGEDGIVGEDVTKTAVHLRNVPKKVPCKENFEVRGEGVVSWADFELLKRGNESTHPRNVAAGAVRAQTPDKGRLSHIDFVAFELIYADDESTTKCEQLEFLTKNGFFTVSYDLIAASRGEKAFREALKAFLPETCRFPVDGVIAEFNDLDYGRSLGATLHHENRMMALKWEDELYETVFRGVTAAVTRGGRITLTAEFDPVKIDGVMIHRADLHSLGTFENLQLGEGDKIKVYKANMIIPQIAENLTKSGKAKAPTRCPCCGEELQLRISDGGSRNLYCPNEDCTARNAQKLAHFCDSDAMNIRGMSALVLETLIAYGIVTNYADLYHMDRFRDRFLSIPGFGIGTYDKLQQAVEESRRCTLARFLVAVGIPRLSVSAALELDEYFEGSWVRFEKAMWDGYNFSMIAGVPYSLSERLHEWYADAEEEKLWRPVLNEITFSERTAAGEDGNPFARAVIAVTGSVNGMNVAETEELLCTLGAVIDSGVTSKTAYLIVGSDPDSELLAKALENGCKIITESHLTRLLRQISA